MSKEFGGEYDINLVGGGHPWVRGGKTSEAEPGLLLPSIAYMFYT